MSVVLSSIHKFSKCFLKVHKILDPGDLERTMRSLLFQGDFGVIFWVFSLGSCFLLVHLLGTLSDKM